MNISLVGTALRLFSVALHGEIVAIGNEPSMESRTAQKALIRCFKKVERKGRSGRGNY